MHILVCIKQTPETDEVKVDKETGCLVREGVSCALNPFDEYAIEEAVKIKEQTENTIVSAVTMGPPQAESVLKDAVSRGVDNGFHISAKEFAGSDTWATSYALSKTIEKISKEKGQVDLVICGKQTNDSDTGHIGPQIAAWLNWPNCAYVRKIQKIDKDFLIVERMTEDGADTIKLPFPCVLSVLKEINTPRIPSLKGRLKARKATFTKWNAADIGCDIKKLGMDGSPTSVVKCFTPKPRKQGTVIEGGDEIEKAKKLVSILKEFK